MPEFVMDGDAVDLRKLPMRKLNTGALMPPVGMGTFGSDRFGGDEIAEAVRGALRVGYRLVDCASVYGNEEKIGAVLREAIGGGLPRKELFVMSKVWNDMHAPGDVVRSCKQSLKNLRLDYLDCYFVHWPFPNFHPRGCSADTRQPDSRPYIHEEFMKTWRAMESLVNMGLVRHIGVSNVTIPKLELILRDVRIQPSLCEMELHPCFQQARLFQYCLDHKIQPVGFCPIGSPARPDRDKTPDDLVDIEQPVVVNIAKAHGVHPAVICLKWAVAYGAVPIPFSLKRKNYLANLQCAAEDPLTFQEIEDLKSVDRNCRLIKGQVFLWPGADTWLDLWDADGTIPRWNGYENCRHG